MIKKTLIVEGMTCAACSSAVERIMNKQEAVKFANVNLTTKKLVMEYDENNLNIEKIVEIIGKAGFDAKEFVLDKKVIIPIDGMT